MAASTCAKLLSQPRKIFGKPQIVWQSYRNLRKIVPRMFETKRTNTVKTVSNFMKELPDTIGYKPVARHPGEYLTMADVMEELNAKDPELDRVIDISVPAPKINDKERRKLELEQRDFIRKLKGDLKLERAARLRTLKIPLDEVRLEWQRTNGPVQLAIIAEHYGLYRDLFCDARFVPRVQLQIAYDFNEEFVTQVYRGNHITPLEASAAPNVQFESDPDTLWTLVLTNLDGHLQDSNAEYLHWFIGNIPGNNLAKGDLICDYLRPVPPMGTGFHRLVFILYKQEQRIDYSALKRQMPCLRLKERTFRTFDFYKERQEVLTPAGLAFFQSSHDESLRKFFHDVLHMREPSFEYDFPKHYVKAQKIIPHKQPFNVFLEKYRDPQDVGKEILLKRLKNINPFEPEPARPKYPNAYPEPNNIPSWQRTELYRERMRVGKYRGLDVEIFKPERPDKYNPRLCPRQDDFAKHNR